MKAVLRITLPLTSIVVTLTLLASFFGLIPDRDRMVESNRAVLAESIAIHITSLMLNQQSRIIKKDLEYYANRHDDLLSIGVRRADGILIAAVGEHDQYWAPSDHEGSTQHQIKVPIWNGNSKWGEVELRFEPLHGSDPISLIQRPTIQLPLGMGLASFIVFSIFFFSRRGTITPSQAVPSRVQSALDTLAEGLLIVDPKGQIMLANEAFGGFLDQPADSLQGKNTSELNWRDEHGSPLQKDHFPWMRAISSGEVQKSEPLQLETGNGKILHLQVSCSPVMAENGKPTGALVSFDDISELRRKEAELEKSRAEAEAANRAKSAFLANMSHEIRTPMNAILGFTEILKRGYVHNQKENLRYLDIINSSGQSLLELINDILDLSKVESGKMEMEISRIQPYKIVYEAIQVLALRANEKGIRLDYDVIGEIPEYIESDPTRLRQMIINLVGNAIKFTEQGGVRVVCRYDDSDEAPKMVFAISDTGIGMTAEQLENIFNPFVQADSSTTRRFGGTGLGLTISKRFAEALGGDISVSSEPGRGSTFTVTIATGQLSDVRFISPDEIELAAAADEEQVVSKWVLPAARVLVVDDGAENRELVRFLLEEAGLVVDEAENGRKALERVRTQHYELILMDVQMPEMDGFTATRHMRESGLETPIIALTANAMKGFEQECLAAGYSGYFSKPIDVDRFMEKMASLLGGRQITIPRETVDAPASRPSPTAPPNTTVRRKKNKPPIYPEFPVQSDKLEAIAAKFIPRVRSQVEEMQSAWKKRDLDHLADLAHWLKGAGGTVGFKVFHDPAAKLEKAAKSQSEAEIPRLLEEIDEYVGRLATRTGCENLIKTEEEEHCEFQPLPAGKIESRLSANPRFHRTIRSFVEKLKAKMAEVEQLYATGDLEALRLVAHWIKGSAGTVGFDAFTEPARRLEQLARDAKRKEMAEVITYLRKLTDAVEAPREKKNTARVLSP